MNQNTNISKQGRILFYGGLVLAYITVLLAFLFLADLTQFILHAPREVHIGIFKIRKVLMVIGIIGFLVAMAINFKYRLVGWKGVSIHAFVFVGLFVGGFWLVTYIMFIPQPTQAEFISIKDANKYINYEDEVMVIDVKGDARAYPHLWMRQPHIVGETIGGEEVLMTYCSLSHSGLAYSPVLDGERLDLKVFTQLQNNLIMYDTNTDEPIQQITGTTEHSGKNLKEYPVQVMSYEAFRDLYPQGKVFYNPPRGFRDDLTRGMLMTVINWQHEMFGPVFPTIDVEAEGINQLHPKEEVWGVKLNGEQVAYTYDYFKANNWVVNDTLGGKQIILVYYLEHRTVAGFEREVNGSLVSIDNANQIDAYGKTEWGELKRIPVISEVFWMIWHTFYPETDLKHHV
ncbi:MAG: DUF3179 domain-containing protein [Gammaproteobacteria bacterium]|jgi:hypothetical protein|nr:DUF3179 domain-containing protein [Gammaproteobacteria bacterium]